MRNFNGNQTLDIMGEQKVGRITTREDRGDFVAQLLTDIQALERMLEQGLIENDVIRIGAEQEFCLVDANWRPSSRSEEVLASINDTHFTTELARFNLEINLDPLELSGNCFRVMETQLTTLLKKAHQHARKLDNKVVLTGILPTISKQEVDFEFMTPIPRYWALNDAIKEMRGRDFELRLRGVDEVTLKHDCILFEACNTSFQMHLQIEPDDFIASYNWAQAISGPVLGIATNSPMLLGRELWSETRIALFQQSIDMRSSSYALQNQQPRVAFGSAWAKDSIADIYKDDIAQYPILLGKEIPTNSLEQLAQGDIPKLPALMLHNGTVYRWNRACYGVGGGKPHLRIENRYIPSGPTTQDEMANFAFWAGLMKGRPPAYDNMSAVMDFKVAKSNFIRAARTGKSTVIDWMGQAMSVKDLILKELLPMAQSGLESMGVHANDIQHYLGIIEARSQSHTGSQWMVRNYRKLCAAHKQDDALVGLTKVMYENQQSEKPVHRWEEVNLHSKKNETAQTVGHIMSTQLFTVNENDLADLATSIMSWKDVHHLPVENDAKKLTGLLTWTHMNRFQQQGYDIAETYVSDIMTRDLILAHPGMGIQEAIGLMKSHEIGCLPVVKEDLLLGIITIKDVIEFDESRSI